MDAGELTEEEAAVSERRNIILQALGPDPNVKVDLTRQDVRKGDILIMCSDGLSGLVPKDDMLKVVSEQPDLVSVCRELIELANSRGGPDNITCIVARFGGDIPDPDGNEQVGHQVYPLLDTESTTEPVPVYRGQRKTEPAATIPSTPAAPDQPQTSDSPTVPVPIPDTPKKKSWWPF